MALPPFIGRLPAKGRPTADFAPEEFRKQILTHGLEAVWQQNAECPCSQFSTSYGIGLTALPIVEVVNEKDVLANCPVCGGDGYILHTPTPIKLLMSTFASTPGFQYFGEYIVGSMSGTFLPENLVSLGDRVTVTNCTMIFREKRKRTAGATQSLRYPIASRVLDLVTGEFTVGVTYCHKATADGVAVVGGTLVEGEDFIVNGSGEIDWTLGDGLGSAPLVGDQFAMSYYVAPVYVVTDLPYSVRDTIVRAKLPSPVHSRMPVNATLVLEFMNTQKDPA